MERLIAPSALDAQGSQATLVLRKLKQAYALSRKSRFGSFHRSSFVNKLSRSRRSFTLANEAIVIRGLRRALTAIGKRRGIKGEETTALFKTLKRRLAAARRAHRRRRQLPASLQGLFAPPVAPIDKVKHFPTPTPTPPQPGDAATSLSETCSPDVNTAASQSITVSGRLTPAPPAATIRLVYTPPGGTPFARTALADGNGNWSNTLDPQTDHGDGVTFGNWTVRAHFDGSPGFQASQSGTCTVFVHD